MDINRVPNEKKLDLCQWYFRGKFGITIKVMECRLFLINYILIYFDSLTAGFAFLPFVWVVNVVWFFESAFKKPPFDEQNAIRRCKLTSI